MVLGANEGRYSTERDCEGYQSSVRDKSDVQAGWLYNRIGKPMKHVVHSHWSW